MRWPPPARVDADGRAVTARVPVVGPLFGLFFVPEGDPTCTTTTVRWRRPRTGLYARFFRAMLDRGVALAPGPYEMAFPSMAHGAAEYESTLASRGRVPSSRHWPPDRVAPLSFKSGALSADLPVGGWITPPTPCWGRMTATRGPSEQHVTDLPVPNGTRLG